jgi:hypothetical protein
LYILGFPLLIIPIAVYAIIAYITPVPWDTTITTVSMISGGVWKVTLSDLLLALALVCLFFEVFKATRHGTRAIVDHMLSTLVFICALVGFLLIDRAATSTFALILMICLVDVIAGYTVSIKIAQRDYVVDRSEAN